jgi:hypothetical protein
MGADGSLLVLDFALCGVGALAGIVVPERRNPALLAWVGSLATFAEERLTSFWLPVSRRW